LWLQVRSPRFVASGFGVRGFKYLKKGRKFYDDTPGALVPGVFLCLCALEWGFYGGLVFLISMIR
jgi:hypothetical protein